MSDIREDIVEWINGQHYWVRYVSEKLLRGNSADSLDYPDVLTKVETPNEEEIDFSFFLSGSSQDGELILNSIGNIKGIGELDPIRPLELGLGLNVIYGNNGSGKSGYTKILKKASCHPDATELRANVFQATPETQSCDFVVNGEALSWNNSDGCIDEISGIDIFDTDTGLRYLDKESGLSYLPLEMAFFEELTHAFQKLKEHIENQKNALVTHLPALPNTSFKNSHMMRAIYEDLSAESNFDEFKERILLSDAEKAQIKGLQERIEQDPQILINRKKQVKHSLIALQATLNRAIGSVCQTKADEILAAHQAYQDSKNKSQQAADVLSGASDLEGVGSNTWKVLWEAARKYSEELAYQEAGFPNLGEESHCVLCHQPLSEEAKLRLESFESFIQNDVEKDFQECTAHLKGLLANLPTMPSDEEIKTQISACHLDEEEWFDPVKLKWAEVINITEYLKSPNDGFEYAELTLGDKLDGLGLMISSLEQEISNHEEDSQNIDIQALQMSLEELLAKEWLGSYLEDIEAEIERLKEVSKRDEWIRQCHTRRVTQKAADLSEIMITDAYVSRFNEELSAFTVGKRPLRVELVKTRVRDGEIKHGIKLKGIDSSIPSIKITEILSEGEQRIVALAAFLADVKSNPFSAPFIFDDPISSLDHLYEENVAETLVSLSETRQVIVFTHRLSLVGLLISLASSSFKEDQVQSINRISTKVGLPSSLPLFAKTPIKALKNIRNDRFVKTSKFFERGEIEDYNVLMKAILSDFRVLVERLIEVDIISGVVQRHSRAVQTLGRLNKLSVLSIADCDLINGLMTELSKFEHSQSDELPVEIPEPDYVGKLLDQVISWHSDYSSRQKQVS